MSVFAPIRINRHNKVGFMDYIRTENENESDESKPAEPVAPADPEVK